MLRAATGLVNDVRRSGRWQALFTAEAINGWLAYDVPTNHPQLFPRSIRDLRVCIDDDRVQVAFNWHKALWSAVVSMDAEVYLREPNVVAVRICDLRAGMLPLPLGVLLHDLIASGNELGLQIEQQQVEGDPTILITLPTANDAGDKQLCLEALELSKGEIYVAGRSERSEFEAPIARKSSHVTPASAEPEAQLQNKKVQR